MAYRCLLWYAIVIILAFGKAAKVVRFYQQYDAAQQAGAEELNNLQHTLYLFFVALQYQ